MGQGPTPCPRFWRFGPDPRSVFWSLRLGGIREPAFSCIKDAGFFGVGHMEFAEAIAKRIQDLAKSNWEHHWIQVQESKRRQLKNPGSL